MNLTLNSIIDKAKATFNRNKIGPIGLEISMEKIHLVQLQKETSGKIHYRAKTSLAYTISRDDLLASPKIMKAMLRTAFKSEPFFGRKIVMVIPPSDVRILSVAYQVSKGQKEDEALLKLMGNRIHGDLTDYVIDYLPIRAKSESDERLAIIAYAKRERIITCLETMRKSGLIVEAMEIGPSAIKRLISAMSTGVENEGNVLVINFGYIKSYMTLISGRRLLFDQEIEFGEEVLLKQLSVLLDVTIENARNLIIKHGLHTNDVQLTNYKDEVAGINIPESINEILKPMFMQFSDEINRALIYAASETRGESVKHVYLLGSIARWKGADKMLNLLVNLPVSIPNPLMMFGNDKKFGNDPSTDKVSEIAVATGLALRGVLANG